MERWIQFKTYINITAMSVKAYSIVLRFGLFVSKDINQVHAYCLLCEIVEDCVTISIFSNTKDYSRYLFTGEIIVIHILSYITQINSMKARYTI